jgi:type I restriction enzyme S subunit
MLKKHVELLDVPNYAVMIRTTNFENNDFTENLKYVTRNTYEFMEKSKVFPGDILMNKIANAGSVYFMPDLKRPVSLAMNLFLIRLNKERVSQKFIYKYLKCNENYIKTFAIGTAATTITKNAVRKLQISLPPLPIQRKIAAVLSAYDDLIENNNRRIAILEKMAEELYREWFVRLRFPRHENVKIVKGVPEGWEMKKLGEFIQFEKGKNPSNLYSDKTMDNEIYLNVDAIENKHYQYALKQKSVLCERDETLMLMDGARSSVVFTGNAGVVSSTFAVIRTEKKYRPLIHQYFISNFEALVSNNTGSAIPHANKEFIIRMGIYLPKTDDLLIEFNKQYIFITSEKDILKKRNEILSSIRDRLLSRLMSGKIDVEKLDIEFPPSMKEELDG